MSLVLDASITLAWVLPGERTREIESVFEMVLSNGAIVPDLWRIEVANVLMLSVRRSCITPAYRDDSLEDLDDLSIFIDSETSRHAWSRTLVLAEKHCPTLYDSTYLELAQRTELPLATLDRDLRQAAKRERLPLLGL